MQYPTLLECVFRHYTNGAETMNVHQYLKFANGCNFLDKKFTKTDIASIFAKSITKTMKRIDFDKFKENLSLFTLKKGGTKNDIVRKIEAHGRQLFCSDPFSFVTVKEIAAPSIKGSLSTGSSGTEISTMSDLSVTPVKQIKQK